MPSTSAHLWIVATPIGNPGDISSRACKILASADLVLAEDTRRARSLFSKLGIPVKRIISLFEHNESSRLAEVLEALASGANIALISDAGTPILSDPGYQLVNACRQAGVPVSPVPGPSAPVAALSASGFPPVPFSFLGFLPRAAGGITAIFTRFRNTPGSIIFFERKNRLKTSLQIASIIFENRRVAICRELTKEHEEFIFGDLGNLAFLPDNLLGEITVIIAPAASNNRTPREEVILLIDQAIDEGLKPRVAARLISEKCEAWTADEIYQLMEEIKKEADL